MSIEHEQSRSAQDVENNTPSQPPQPLPIDSKSPIPSDASWLTHIWINLPDRFFRFLGASFFLAFLALELSDYIRSGFWESWRYWRFSHGHVLYMPWARVLIDITYLLMALSFIFRISPQYRARRGREIWIPILGAFWPFGPFILKAILGYGWPDVAAQYSAFMFDIHLSFPAFMVGTGCVLAGNILDVWGYAILFRSFSIVAEARQLKVVGPYRLIRHPIYFGQMLAQAGIWLVFASFHGVWITFYLCFAALQLYRSWVEDQVLERAFGEPYRNWKRKTFWFF